MGSKVWVLAAVVLAALVVVPSPAVAAPIAIESYEGERPADADALLAPAYAELARRGFIVQGALAAQVDKALSRGSAQLTASQGIEAQKLIDRGYQSFIDGDYAAAVASVNKGLAIYAAAPGQVAREEALRDLQFKGLLVAARSYEVLKKGEDAFRLMAEAIRSFPDRHVSTAEFDPKVNALFRKVKAELTRQGTGSLEVKVDDAAAVVFLNERFVGTGAVTVPGLFPGTYRVYVAKGAQPGRVRDVSVSAGGQAVIAVSWAIDSVLRSGSGYLGLEHPRGSGTEGELATATRLGRELDAASVVVLGIRSIDGRRAVIGYAVSTSSQTRSFAAVQVEPVEAPPERLTTLAAFLSGDKSVTPDGLITREPRGARPRVAGPDPDEPSDEVSSSRFGAWTWVTTGAGVAAVGAGVTLFLLDEDNVSGGTRQEKAFNGKTPGYVAGGIGVALIAAGAYMFITDGGGESEGPVMSIAPTPDGATFAVSGRF
jgi:hypothetical protein